jgi:hypothetical protein
MTQPAQTFYLTKTSPIAKNQTVMPLNWKQFKAFASDYLRGVYGIATHQWLVSTQKPISKSK